MEINNGTFIAGQFISVEAKAWERNGKSGMNHNLIIAEPFIDNNGLQQNNVHVISVKEPDYNVLVSKQAAWKGKRLIVPVRFTARTGGRTGAWNSIFKPENLDIQVI